MATMAGAGRQESNHRHFSYPENLDPKGLEILYDHELDTLFVHLFGQERRATCRLTGEYAYYRVDPKTHHVVGLQIESFLRRAVPEHPALVGLLRHAELRGVSFDQIQHESTKGFPAPLRWLVRVRIGLGLMLPSSAEQSARQAIAALRLFAPADIGAATSSVGPELRA